jgi:RNA polymerase sigma-70 factor (ECF subfamily)
VPTPRRSARAKALVARPGDNRRVDDHALLEAARSGDKAALETFIERHQSRVLRFGLKMCRDTEDARDVAQETLLAAARSVNRFREASSPSTWLYTIARSFCIKKRRKSKFAPATVLSLDGEGLEAAAAVPDPGRDPERELQDRRLVAALDAAISALDPKHREILVLRDVEGLAASEVAEVTGLSVEAVKSRLHRARLQVRERLAPLLGRIPAPASGCPDVLRLFSRHLENEIDPATCAEMERHLSTCPRCQATCDSLKRVLTLCRRSGVPDVPSDLQESVRSGIRAFLARP